MADLLAELAGAALLLWGAAHLAPTTRVADSFGEISTDNRRILVMEWIAEGLAHVSLGTLVILVAASHGSSGGESHLVYRTVAATLITLATLTTLTGARTPVVWFKICPLVLTGAAGLLIAASLL